MRNFNPSVILSLAPLQPKRFPFFLRKRQFSHIRSRVPVPFLPTFNFEQYPSFPSRYNRDNVEILSQLPKSESGQNVNYARAVEQFDFKECHMNFVVRHLQTEFKAICPLQGTKSCSTASSI
jgi:hypothetical protein